MKRIVLIIAFLSIGVTFAQNAKVESKVISKFQKAYNDSNYKGIYAMYSENKQETFSLEDTKAFFERVHAAKGDITSLTLVRNQKEYTVYKAVFTKTVGEVVIKLNNKGKADILSTRNTEAVKQ
ncbi:DUF3887 domain-containing protein [uncultured Lacinutrix sp.]|uniref:DUF3887 domain-containing protein n=1 Tax=uncultured Lacinutrix sp. TaxID=574032 RepID=UPI002625F095|nr:DUF3887 domain-containing protein [uncultured Lacinutrix sp.]